MSGRLTLGQRLHMFFSWHLPSAIVRSVLFIFYRFRVIGPPPELPEGPVILVANHQSHFDPPMMSMVVNDRPAKFLARASLFDFKPFGAMIRFMHAVPLQRGGGAGSAIRTAQSVLEAGGRVILFPEGTRTRDGAMQAFKPGFLLLVRKTKAPVLPVAFEGAYDVWPSGRSRPRASGRLISKAGTVISGEELLAMKPDEATERIRRAIETLRLELRAELRRRTKGRYPAPGLGDKPYWELEAGEEGQGRAARTGYSLL